MDYKQKYEEALEWAKSFESPEHKDIMASVFPELKQSEDKRVIDALIDFFSLGAKNNEVYQADTKSFLCLKQKVEGVVKWAYVEDILNLSKNK